MKPSVRTATHRLLAAGLFGLGIAAAAYGTLHVTFGPRPVSIHVRWAPGVEDTVRQEAEQRYHLSEESYWKGVPGRTPSMTALARTLAPSSATRSSRIHTTLTAPRCASALLHRDVPIPTSPSGSREASGA